MMYGFGDSECPRADTAELVEDLVVDYIADVVARAVAFGLVANPPPVPGAAGTSGAGGAPFPYRLRTEDVLHVLRDEPKKVARVEELLFMNEEVKRARRVMDIDEEAAARM